MDELRKAPGLGAALRSLRERAGLSRPQVIAALSEAKRNRTGDPTAEYSSDWYARVETRERSHPSETDLDDILQIIGSDRTQLRVELGIEGAASIPASPASADFSAQACSPQSRSMRSYRNQDGAASTFSSLSEDFGPSFAAPRHLLSSIDRGYDTTTPSIGSADADAGLLPARAIGEEDQLLDTFRKLSPDNRARALAHTRSLLGRQQ